MRFVKGDLLTADTLNRALSELERVGSIVAAPPLRMQDTANGIYLSLDEGRFPAVICSSGASSSDPTCFGGYGFKEVQYKGGGDFEVMPGGRSACGGAFEVNGNETFDGTVVELNESGVQGEWYFFNTSDPLKPVDCGGGSSSSSQSSASSGCDFTDTLTFKATSCDDDGNPVDTCYTVKFPFAVTICTTPGDCDGISSSGGGG